MKDESERPKTGRLVQPARRDGGLEANSDGHGNGSDNSGSPAETPEPDTVLNYEPESEEERARLWKGRITRYAWEILRADPEYHKAHLTFDLVREPLTRELLELISSTGHNSAYAAFRPPAEFQNGDLEHTLAIACEAAWENYKQYDRNDLLLDSLNDLPEPPPPPTEEPTHGRKRKPKDEQPDVELPYTQDWLALRFTEKWGDDLRYTDDWGQWHIWSEHVWRRDNTIHVFDKARDLCREYAKEVGQGKTKKELSDAKTVAAIERMCKADRRHAATIELWDTHIQWLNTPKGVFEMDQGRARPNQRADYFTKVSAIHADFKMACPLWNQLLNRVLPDEELRLYLQRIAGYCLTGSVSEHALFFWYGHGANGKTTILNAIVGVMGDYAKPASSEILMISKFERHPTEIAELQGARLVVANEIERGQTWAEAKIAELTGGSQLSARFMRQDLFKFWPQFKLVISGNHKPSLRGVTEAMRRRFHMFPFNVTIPRAERDTSLGDKLRAEWPGILAWMIEGVRMWQQQGLNPPAQALEATAEYLKEEDLIQQWIDECCLIGGEFGSSLSVLFLSWKSWAERNNQFVGSNKNLSQQLLEHGYEKDRNFAGMYFKRIAVKATQDEPNF